MKMQKALISIFKEAVKSVSPETLIRSNIEVNEVANRVRICDKWLDGGKNYHVLGFGKAVYGMAIAVEKSLQSRIESGILSVPPGTYASISKIAVHSGANNNLPDEQSLSTTEKILNLSRSIPKEDVVIVLISGGGSSLLCKPVPGVSLQEKLLTIKCLTSAGANIHELNTVRKAISAVKGGKLAKALQGRTVISLILSDVIGDSLDIIASGPTVPNPTTSAMEVVQKYRLELKIPKNVLNIINDPSEITLHTENLSNFIIGSNTIALQAVLKTREISEIPKFVISSTVDGLVDKVAAAYLDLSLAILQLKIDGQVPTMLARIRQWLRRNDNWSVTEAIFNEVIEACLKKEGGILLALGGEPTVEVNGTGKGGRSQELALLFSKLCYNAKQEHPTIFQDWDVMLLCSGTDGIDGPTDAAGAIGCADVIEKGKMHNLEVDSFINANNSYKYLRIADNGSFHIKTGYTGTNVMDLHLILIYRKPMSDLCNKVT